MNTLENLAEKALLLSKEDRLQIARALLDSVDGSAEIKAEWLSDCKRRLDEIEHQLTYENSLKESSCHPSPK